MERYLIYRAVVHRQATQYHVQYRRGDGDVLIITEPALLTMRMTISMYNIHVLHIYSIFVIHAVMLLSLHKRLSPPVLLRSWYMVLIWSRLLCMSCSVGCWITTANCSWHLRRRLWWGHGQASRRKKTRRALMMRKLNVILWCSRHFTIYIHLGCDLNNTIWF